MRMEVNKRDIEIEIERGRGLKGPGRFADCVYGFYEWRVHYTATNSQWFESI